MTRSWMAILGVLVALAIGLASCSFGWPATDEPSRALRPAATSTPASSLTPKKRGPGLPLITQPSVAKAARVAADAPPTTEEQLAAIAAPTRDLRDLALRLRPEVDDIPIVVNASVPEFQVGAVQTFSVQNPDTNRIFEIDAELIYTTDVAYVWVETGKEYDYEAIVQAIDRFSTESYPAEVSFFGSEWNPGVDNDPRLHILHATQVGAGYAAYYSSTDEYSKLAYPSSNEKEMFYINLDWLNSSRDYDYYATVLTHEFQHMVHWHIDRNEETWVNEGLSEYAQEVAGYGSDTIFASNFANYPDTQLNNWSEDPDGRSQHYGNAYLFVRYFAQRFGPERIAELVAHPANGVAGFDAVLAAIGLEQNAPLNLDTVFADWVVANYVDDPNALGLDGVYGYRDLTQNAPVLDQSYVSYPTDMRRSDVHNYAADYVLLGGEGDVSIFFEGQTETRLADSAPYSGEMVWWSNRGDRLDSRLTRVIDLREAPADGPIEMQVKMWWEIESDYDYGYVLASRNGVKWDILSGQRSTTENPTGNNFGSGYTGRSTADTDDQDAIWLTETFDLSAYRGEEIQVRFEYVADDAVSASGWLIDDITIPALDYATDFEAGADGWESEGWLLSDNRLQQRWLLQVLHLEDNLLREVERFAVDEQGYARIDIQGLGDGVTAVLAISALAPVTTEPATYEFRIEPTAE